MDQESRPAIDNFGKHRKPAGQIGKSDIHEEKRHDENDGICDGEIISQQRLLGRFGNDQEEHKIEGRRLSHRSATGEPDDDQQNKINRYTANDAFHQLLFITATQ